MLQRQIRMDYLSKIDDIIQKLQENGESDIADRINSSKTGSYTASEILMSITSELLRVIEAPRLRELIGKDCIELRDYCHSIGLMVR